MKVENRDGSLDSRAGLRYTRHFAGYGFMFSCSSFALFREDLERGV
jgi:hypothetical protein